MTGRDVDVRAGSTGSASRTGPDIDGHWKRPSVPSSDRRQALNSGRHTRAPEVCRPRGSTAFDLILKACLSGCVDQSGTNTHISRRHPGARRSREPGSTNADVDESGRKQRKPFRFVLHRQRLWMPGSAARPRDDIAGLVSVIPTAQDADASIRSRARPRSTGPSTHLEFSTPSPEVRDLGLGENSRTEPKVVLNDRWHLSAHTASEVVRHSRQRQKRPPGDVPHGRREGRAFSGPPMRLSRSGDQRPLNL